MNTISLRITKDEARMGCTKLVYPQELAHPVTVCVPPKAVDGQLYRMSLMAEGTSDLPDTLFVRVSVIKKRHVIDTVSVIATIVLIVCVILICSGKSRNIKDRIDDIRSDIASMISSPGTPENDTPQQLPESPVFDAADLAVSAGELIPHFSDRYFLSAMTDEQLVDFCALYRSAMNFEELCVLPRGVDNDTLISMLTALQYECPELIQLDFSSNISYSYNQATSIVTSVSLKYKMTQDEYKEKYAQCCAIIDRLKKATAGYDNAAKEVYVYNFFVSENRYDMDAEFASSAYGALVVHDAKCDGFSLAFKWVLEELGIQCISLRGDPVDGTIGHAWNMVNLDGSFYSVDVTADIKSDDSNRGPLYVAYNVSSAWIAKNYTVSGGLENFRAIPICSTMSRSFHVLNDTFIYSGQNPVEMFYKQLDNIKANSGYVMLQFESDEDRAYFIDNIEGYYEQWAVKNGGPACVYSYTEMYNMLYLSLQ